MPLPPRYPITAEGLEVLRKELSQLKMVERPRIAQAIATARAKGDLKENAEYHAAREKQSFMEARMRYLEARTAGAQIIDVSKLSGDTVKFGAAVRLIDAENDAERHYRLVGAAEADLEKGWISIESPLAKALIGRSVGDRIEVSVPSGEKFYKIGTISYDGTISSDGTTAG